MPRRCLPALLCCLLASPLLPADEPATKKDAGRSVEELAKQARDSIVVIKYTGREGKPTGVGTGFVISADGLIATNLHVIGEARPINIALPDGKELPAKVVHASDRSLDLAVVQVEANRLKPLPLGDSDTLENGQGIIALGHPRGLEHSVVAGVVSGRPKIEGRSMIQLAIPIEQGNSGGPVLDRQGRVVGVVTLKSQVTPNLGFAVPVNALKKLLARPNPIPMERWVTIGQLNDSEWLIRHGGRWRQRSGVISVEGPGTGFGGRCLCLSKTPVPVVPFEVAVRVKLGEETGAAGLAFHADGGDKHYGFYPSNGKLRLSRFEGPDVFSWKVLEEITSPHYRPGEWNALKVRIEKDRLLCYLNDQLVIEATDKELPAGSVGLVMFRNTPTEFKHFRLGKTIPSTAPPPSLVERIGKLVRELKGKEPVGDNLVQELLPQAASSAELLRQQARELEEKAARLRRLAQAVQQARVLKDLEQAIQKPTIDLVHASLLIAQLDNEELDIDSYRQQVERLAQEIKDKLPSNPADKARLAALNKELFEVRGFHGSRSEYYHRNNSYLNSVLDDREGLPITLAVLYLEVGRRIGLKLEGIGLPGHFVVRHIPAKGPPQLIDVFEGGKVLSRQEAEKKVREITGEPLQEEHLQAVSAKAILLRILHNLSNLAKRDEDLPGLLRYLDAMLTIDAGQVEERLLRSAARYQNGDRAGALADLDWLLQNNPPGINRERLLQLRRLLDKKR